ncbi:MAG: 4Fe-4S binding protein [Methanomicrobiaceae archaeon]|nr:4Fe-4S binding protein [Methanomicrobiaceae archaeon]MDD5418880.1 4Fe-4S binding protein [Methanomicrobiaceae archaeon]
MSEELKRKIRERCRAMEIPLVGIADVERWEHPPMQPWMPEEFYPQSIFPEARSVIVIGLPVHLPVLETAPSIYYRELYRIINALLDQYTYRLAGFLNEQGHPSVFVPRDAYGSIEVLLSNPIAFFSHRHAAFLAGLGTFGVNNMILTPEYGPRVRFGSVLTAAALPPDPILSRRLCTRCMQCVRMCPSGALEDEDYPAGLTDRQACAAHSAELNRRFVSPCGICIKVCPVGEDRRLYSREDASLYRDREGHEQYHDAWEHVRRYGGGS